MTPFARHALSLTGFTACENDDRYAFPGEVLGKDAAHKAGASCKNDVFLGVHGVLPVYHFGPHMVSGAISFTGKYQQ